MVYLTPFIIGAYTLIVCVLIVHISRLKQQIKFWKEQSKMWVESTENALNGWKERIDVTDQIIQTMIQFTSRVREGLATDQEIKEYYEFLGRLTSLNKNAANSLSCMVEETTSR